MKTFKVRAETPKATILNRPLLLAIFAVLVGILLWALFAAFEPKAVKNKQLSAGRFDDVATSPLLNTLPKNYQDVGAIQKYLSSDQLIPPAVATELNALRSQEAALQAQLAKMNEEDNAPDTTTPSGQEAAVRSDLFFSSEKPASSLFDANANKNNNGNNLGVNGQSSAYAQNTPYAQQNMQSQKSNFLQAPQVQGDIYNQYKMVKPISPYEVQAGTIIAADLLTAINTSLPGDIIAQIRQDVYDTVTGHYLLIPKGSKLLGKYDSSVAYGQERVLIAFDRIIRPDGTSIQLNNFTGSDEVGTAGFAANVDNHWSKILGAATISTLLSFGAGMAADNASNNNNNYPNNRQNGISGAASSVSQTGQTITNRAVDVQPTLTVPTGFNFNVIVNKDMILQPYVSKTL